jgi:hypothetical protein
MMPRILFQELHDTSIDVRSTIGDLRFRSLLSAEEWVALPVPVRRRFSERVADGRTVLYVGEVVACAMNPVGWLFAQVARLCGGPLPLTRETHMPAVVTVSEDTATKGQIWTRLYTRRNGFPQVIHSSKQFGGPTGLEEYVGRGVGMALTVHVEDGALKFCSAGYFLRIGNARLPLPRWLTPGALTVTHQDIGGGRFQFVLDVVHPLFGAIIHQAAIFREATP